MSARIRIHEKTRMATLSGVPYLDLRGILTLAANTAYDRIKELADKPEDRAYYEGVIQQIKALEDTTKAQMAHINGYEPPADEDSLPGRLPKVERRARLERNRREETLLNDLVTAASGRRKRVS